MRISRLFKLFLACSLLLSLAFSTFASWTNEEAVKTFPEHISDFHICDPPHLRPVAPIPMQIVGGSAKDLSVASGSYCDPKNLFEVYIWKTPSDAAAYALLTDQVFSLEGRLRLAKEDKVGTVAFTSPNTDYITFYKGPFVVCVWASGESSKRSDSDHATFINFARALADTLDKGTGEIPPLAMHLPDWNSAQERAVYAVSLSGLQATMPNQKALAAIPHDELEILRAQKVLPSQPVLDAVSFEGGTEAVTAKYDQGQLVIIEFQTPQLAADNDARITQRIAELRAKNQPVPSGYKRVGNYAVLVFDAPSEQAAAELINQVKYEKVVQWLGDDPHRFERANRFWLNMSSSLIVNTVKATALAILVCLCVGGLFGGMVFARRRAQAALNEEFTDAGGMMRLNLDELAAEHAHQRLLPPGDD